MKRQLKELRDQIDAAKTRLKETIRGLPSSSDDVQLITPKCGIVSFSTIAKNKGILSPGYYLTQETKVKLIALIDSKVSIASLYDAMEDVIAKGGIQGTKIAPSVLEALKKAWEE